MADEQMKTHAVYYGQMRNRNGEWVHSYAIHQSVSQVGVIQPNFSTVRKLKLRTQPGIVYSFDGSLIDGTVSYHHNSQTYLERHEDATEIQALARAAELDRMAEKKGTQPWTECLAPAAAAYRKANGIQKQIVLALAVAAITGKKK